MNTKIKKILALLLGTALTATCLASCGTEKEDDGIVTISVGDYFPDEQQYPEAYERCMETVRKFEEKYPNVKIEDAKYSFDKKSYMAMAEGGTLPTTYYLPLTETKKIMEMGYAADLTDEFKDRGYYNSLNDFMLNLVSDNGKIFFVPESNYDQTIIVNLDLYKKAGFVDADGNLYQPETWEDLAKTAQTIKEKTGVDGFMLPTNGNCGGWRFTTIAWAYNTVFETQGKDGKWQATFNSPEGEKALQFVKDLRWKYNAIPVDALVSLNDVTEKFAGNNVAMIMGEPNNVNQIIVNYKFNKDNIGMLRLPGADAGVVSMMGGGLRVVDRNATDAQKKAVLDWLEFNGITVNLTDEIKETLDNGILTKKEKNAMIGFKTISPWKDDCEVEQYKNKIAEENINVDPKHIENYNDKTGVSFKAEEPIDAQALYAILDTVVQQVLIDKNADPKAILDKAAKDFQNNNLDTAE